MTPVNWPTVTATEARQGFQDRSRGMKGSQESLSTVVVKSGLADQDNLSSVGSHQESWATPNAFCFQPPENTEQWQKRATMQQEKGVNLHKPVQSQVLHENEKVVGAMPPSAMKLNPRWVETLMGLPVGWVMPSCTSPVTIEPTSCASLETELSLPQQNSPSELFGRN